MKWSAGVRRGTSWETGKLRLSLNIWGKFKNPMVHYLELTSIHHPSQSHDLLLLGIVTIAAMGLHDSTTLFPTDFNPSRQSMGRDMRPWNTYCCEEQDSHHGNISRDTYIYIYVYIFIYIHMIDAFEYCLRSFLLKPYPWRFYHPDQNEPNWI